jgi:poly(3-hydroxybutyrate) depolymerase
MGEARSYQYDSVADDEGFVMLYPQGLAEDGGCGTGWNTGMQGDKSTCTSAATRGSCCYASCRSLGVCTSQDSKCAWASCYDDALFIEQLIDHIGDSACIDLDAIVISGESNGGMLMWDLVKKIPAKFAAVLPIYGAPLVGYGTIPPNKGAADLPMLYLTGRSDRLIPPKGGNGGGWLYLSAAASVANVAATHGCSSSTRSATTPYSGGRHNLACVEHTGCSGGRVMLCEYDGGHSFSSTLNAEKLAWWFASQFITRADATMIANNSTA